jgi:hypothetical protein
MRGGRRRSVSSVVAAHLDSSISFFAESRQGASDSEQ